MRDNLIKSILISVISGLITAVIVFILEKTQVLNISIPLWIYLTLTCVVFGIVLLVLFIINFFRIKKIINTFTESSFGDSYVYTWEYKRGKGKYSVYGYEPYKIQLKRPLSEMNNEHTITFGHEVPEETIKMFIQLELIIMVDKRIGNTLLPVLEYLNWTENNQKYPLH